VSDIANPPELPPDNSTEFSRALGRFLRAARRRAGWTMGDVADVMRCSVGRVSDIEHGYETPTADELDRFGGTLGPKLPRRRL
jgi:ribosome-binding protein aMBF1 (putative translation factor)